MTSLLALCVFAAAEQEPAPLSAFDEPVQFDALDLAELDQARAFSYLNGIGFDGRTAEVLWETAVGQGNIVTSRLEGGYAFKLPGKLLHLVLRGGFGVSGDGDTHAAAWQGFTGSLGFRHQSVFGNFFVEAGLRLLVGWPGPTGEKPEAQALALGATLASGAADDARWLPIRSSGVQVYVEFLSRSRLFGSEETWVRAVGLHYGGQATLVPVAVSTWLGPERQFIGNAYLELFLAISSIRDSPWRFVGGVHGDVSLSSIWPSNLPFPYVVDFFVGWSPVKAPWLSMRLFGGWGGSLADTKTWKGQVGLRLAASF